MEANLASLCESGEVFCWRVADLAQFDVGRLGVNFSTRGFYRSYLFAIFEQMVGDKDSP